MDLDRPHQKRVFQQNFDDFVGDRCRWGGGQDKVGLMVRFKENYILILDDLRAKLRLFMKNRLFRK